MNFRGGKYLLLLSFMTVLFGLSFIATKQALTGLGIFQVVFARHFLALLILTALLWKQKKKFHIARRDRRHFLLLTLIEPVGYFVFETTGVRYTSPAMVSIIIATIPVFSLLFGFWILREKAHPLALAGITMSLAGVYFVVSVQTESFLAPNPLLGNLMTLGAAISAGMYNVLCRRLTRTYSPWTITYYQAMIASVIFLPLAIFESTTLYENYLTWEIVMAVLYLAAGSSVAAYLILNYSLSKLPTYQVATFANLIPVVTISASWLFYKELLSLSQLIGAFIVIMGISLVYFRRSGSE
jgi:drug/metabolite transporter (DMT)-like permease